MEKKDRKELLERIEKELSELRNLDGVIQKIIGDLESQARRLRYQQTLSTEV